MAGWKKFDWESPEAIKQVLEQRFGICLPCVPHIDEQLRRIPA